MLKYFVAVFVGEFERSGAMPEVADFFPTIEMDAAVSGEQVPR
jgi:hypothetical protein